MNLRREVIIAAFLAVMLGIGLGYASYSFIMETKMVQEKPSVKTLDLHTQRGGLGVDGLGGIFEQNETVQLSAYVATDGLPINETEVNFTIRNPDQDEVAESALTDASGTAKVNITLPIEEPVIGNWSVTAVAHVENESVSDSLVFVCEASVPVRRILDLYTQDGGLGVNQSSGFFGPGAVVQLFAYLTAGGFPTNQTEVAFTIIQYGENATIKSALTDDSGIANVNLTLPSNESALGTWSVVAVARFENESVCDYLLFECRITGTPIVPVKALDVYTQRGGLGINESGGIFEQEETVQLYAYLTANGSSVNVTEIVFNVRSPNGTVAVVSAWTDLSGKAKTNLTLPSDSSGVGGWSVLAVANIENGTIRDFMVFECQAKEVIPPTWIIVDMYTNRGGIGLNETYGGVFGPGEVVQIFAALGNTGVGINDTEVVFAISPYGGNVTVVSAFTDAYGTARINFTIPSGSASEGNWTISAVAQVENITVSDFVFFGCGTVSASIQVMTRRGGDLSVNFMPMDNVTVQAHVYCELDLLPAELELEVMYPDGSIFLTQSLATDDLGDATSVFQIPSAGDIFGTWHICISFEARGRHVEGHAYFECQLSEMVIDVYTQRGGQGQNVHSEPFLLGENVTLTVESVGVSNMTLIADKLVSFEMRLNGTTLLVLTAQTDSTGTASVSFSIPSDASYAGQWEVYARADVYGMVLLDTLVFGVEQPQG